LSPVPGHLPPIEALMQAKPPMTWSSTASPACAVAPRSAGTGSWAWSRAGRGQFWHLAYFVGSPFTGPG